MSASKKPRRRKAEEAIAAMVAAGDVAADGVLDLNDRFAVMLAGNKVMILHEVESAEGRPEERFLSVDAFKVWIEHDRRNVGGRAMPAADLWLGSPRRRQYHGLTFAPEGAPPSYYNLWQGWGIEPRPGDCDLFLGHIRDNVCRNDVELFRWVEGWLAHLFQRPWEKPGTALVLQGAQGTGKSKVGEVIGSLMPRYYVHAASPRFILGRFNGHLQKGLLLHADEGFWAGDHEAESKLKDLVTGHDLFIEFKGVEPFTVPNLVRLLVTGNRDWIVPAGMEERRFAVIEVSDRRMQDRAFFKAIDDQMNDGGREALLHHLLHVDLSAVDVRQVPDTGALWRQKVHSMEPLDRWWLDRLRDGRLVQEAADWPDQISCADLHRLYIADAERLGVRRRVSETEFGIALRKLVPGLHRARLSYHDDQAGMTKRRWGYRLPDLDSCRSAFERHTKGTIDWIEEDADEPP
ncbi:MAG: primase-helicase family protein [Inquilinaceae bacterium]